MAMADGVRRLLGADVGLSTTGVAGPAEQEGQLPGTVWLGLAIGDDVDAVLVRLPGDRDRKSVAQGKSVSVRVDLGGRRFTTNKHRELVESEQHGHDVIGHR